MAAEIAGDQGGIYAGCSAGGLAAALTASSDTDTLTLLGLDLVDDSDQALDAVARWLVGDGAVGAL